MLWFHLFLSRNYSNSNKYSIIQLNVLCKPSCFEVLLKWMNKGTNLEGTANSIFISDFHKIPLFSRKPSNVPRKAWLFMETVQSLELLPEKLVFSTLVGTSVFCLDVAPPWHLCPYTGYIRCRLLCSPRPTWNPEVINDFERCLLEIKLSGPMSLTLEPLVLYTLQACTLSTGLSFLLGFPETSQCS